ncbi:MAG: selenocysteine-specific elongation factor, partial [bacterium]
NLATDKAIAGQRTAVNLQGISLEQVGRGQVLVPAKRFESTSMLDVELELLPNVTKSMSQRTRVRLHHDTSEVMARVVLLGGIELIPGQKMFAQLRLEEPTFALPGDRFIVRSYSPQITIGGGKIIDTLPAKHRLKDLKAIDWLNKLINANQVEQIALFIEMAGAKGMSMAAIVSRTGFADVLLNKEIGNLIQSGRLLKSDSQPAYLLAKTAYEQLKTEVFKIMKDFHKREPLQIGINREEVREKIGFIPEIFKLVLDRLVVEKLIVSEKDILRLASHQISLSSEDEQAKKQMETKFKEVGFQARTYDEVMKDFRIDTNKLRKIYQLLVNEQKLLKIGEFVFHREAVNEILDRIKGQKAKNTKLDV